MITRSLGKFTRCQEKGEDSETGESYSSIEQMWKKELDPQSEVKGNKIGTKKEWYAGSIKYWNDQPATVDGVLGGFGNVHEVDSETSRKMIEDYAGRISGFRTAVDMGAGIGRISKDTLLPKFNEVDLVEPAITQLVKAKENVPKIRKFYLNGLQDFQYERKYDCIWVQWCLMYLTDTDLHDFLVRSR